MIRGAGRYRATGEGFSVRPNMGGGGAPPHSSRGGVMVSRGETAALKRETADAQGLPGNTVLTGFAKPTGMSMGTGIVPESPIAQIGLAREIFDNDSVCGAVVETLANIPFGRFSLSGLPDDKHQEPYLHSLDHMRVQMLMPLLAATWMTDGAFLGSGLFDSGKRSWSAMILQDLMQATIYPVPYFGATPIIDVNMTREMIANANSTDPRMQRYRRFLTQDLMHGVQQLQPENTFYIPRRTISSNIYGQSIFRRVMILYILEKALARGTVELAYRRQKPILHIQVGDENWDASINEMQDVARLFMNADTDPFGATVVTRPGVMTQEVGGSGDVWKWTDNIEVLTAAKFKAMGVPDVTGGEMQLDSAAATLTIFINMNRMTRDYLTRAFMYEKMFPYVAITNDHRKDTGAYKEYGRAHPEYDLDHQWLYRDIASDSEVSMADYFMPTVTWHNSLRPEGDRDYLGLLQELNGMGVPVQLRQLASAGGMDIQDTIFGAKDDLVVRGKVAKYRGEIQDIEGALQPQDDQGGDQGGYGETGGIYDGLAKPPRLKGLANRKFDDRLLPRNVINGHHYVTTGREQRRLMERENRIISEARAIVARRENHYARTQKVVHKPHGWRPRI